MNGATLRACVARWMMAASLSLPAASALGAQDEPSKFASAELPYLRYSQLVKETPGEKFYLGSSLLLTSLDTEQARKFFSRPFLIRVFRVAGPGQLPPALADYKPCLVILSSRYPFSGGVRGIQISAGELNSIHWLHLEAGQPVGPGKYLLVFEEMTSDKDLLRIDSRTSADYFAAGLYVEVHPARGRQYGQEEIDQAAQESRATLAAIMPIARDNHGAYTCFKGRRLADAELFQSPELLAACDSLADPGLL